MAEDNTTEEVKALDHIVVTIDETEFEIRRMKGRAARKNITKILGLVGNVMTVAKASGMDIAFITEFITLVFKDRDEAEEAKFQVLLVSLIDELIKMLSTISHLESGGFIDSLEDMLPDVIGCTPEFLDEHGTILEVYGAAVEAIMFQLGVVTPEASEAMRNFQTPSDDEEESPQETTVPLTKSVKEAETPK